MTRSPELKLFVSPGTCARVPTIALEEIGVPFETELVRMNDRQHKSAEFLAINPKGKVPALAIDGEPLTENVAILGWLNQRFPDAGLLPDADTPLQRARHIADLSFFSGTMHPFVTRFARPENFVTDPAVSGQVRETTLKASEPHWTMINTRLAASPWWYGDQWSIVDGYLFWAWWRVCISGFPSEKFPNIKAHADRIMDRPSVQRAMSREEIHIGVLKSEVLFRALG